MRRKVVKNNQTASKGRKRAFVRRRLEMAVITAAVTVLLTSVGAAAKEQTSTSEEIAIEEAYEETAVEMTDADKTVGTDSSDEKENNSKNEADESEEADKTDEIDTQIESATHNGEDETTTLTQYVDENGSKYLLYPDGTHYTGWYNMEPFGELYFDPADDGRAVMGGVGIDFEYGKAYLFDSNGIALKASGTPVINGNKYWVKSDGSLGSGWLYLGNWKMYFDTETYIARTASDGVTDINEKKYLFNSDGVMQNYAGTTVINGAKYWFSSDDASLKSGWLTLGSWKLYFDPETYKGAVGITKIDGKNYLFDSNGVLMTHGTPVVNGKKYYIADDNSLVSGWITSGGWTMYYYPETYEGARGVSDVEGKRYIFDSNGILIKGTGTFICNGKKYAYDSNGNALTGWVVLGKWKMFFDRSTGEAAIGITKIDGKMYMFNNDGVMQNYAGTTVINGKKYWFSDDNASLKSGWLSLNGAKLYFDPNTYAAYTNCTVKIDGYNCRFNKDGVLINDRERDKKYINSLLTYNSRPDIYDGGIDFIRTAKNIVSDNSRGYGHTWPNTISCAGLVGLTLTHLGYGDFIKDDPLGWGYIDLGDEYVSTLINECGATYYNIPINGLNCTKYLQPGDLLYYYYNGSNNHIAIYAGFGYTVEARGPSGATEADDTGYETGIYYLPGEALSFQGFFRLPNLHKIQ